MPPWPQARPPKILQLLKHLCTGTSIGSVYSITLDMHQLMLGISTPILKDSQPIVPWSQALWLDMARQFLHANHGQILLQTPWTPVTQCQNDHYIMEDILDWTFPNNKPANSTACNYIYMLLNNAKSLFLLTLTIVYSSSLLYLTLCLC